MARKKTLPKPPRLVVFDFDGVFTDNKVYIAEDGTETVMCDRRDGLGVAMLRKRGIDMLIVSMEKNPVVSVRARKLGILATQGCGDKAKFLVRHLAERGINPKSVVYMGNDLNDIEAMRLVGFAAAPADAHPAVRKTADHVVSATGGNGAIRELCEFILEKRKAR